MYTITNNFINLYIYINNIIQSIKYRNKINHHEIAAIQKISLAFVHQL